MDRAYVRKFLRERLKAAKEEGYVGEEAKQMIGMGIVIHGFGWFITSPVRDQVDDRQER